MPARQEEPAFQLVCFPHAGGDATAFTPTAHALAPHTEVWALRMPARGGRRSEPMPATFDLLVAAVIEAVRPHLRAPFGFYGQSFGALLAYEVARALPSGRRPELVVTASGQPPGAWAGEAVPERSPAELLRLAGPDDVVHNDPELHSLALAALRRDLAVRRTYRHRPAPPIDADLHAVVGDADPMLDAGQLAGWAEHTAGAFSLSVVPGGHLLATADRHAPVDLLTSIIRRRAELHTQEGPCSPPRPT
ncbi:thioesterase domain-containing protein [Streptomyces sp. NPDC047000]|uniref:thioesterase II family protein n=1 Tax=Streptomyces sp. NPDC047000 TaxID=3155474 RepID=UPI0033F94428